MYMSNVSLTPESLTKDLKDVEESYPQLTNLKQNYQKHPRAEGRMTVGPISLANLRIFEQNQMMPPKTPPLGKVDLKNSSPHEHSFGSDTFDDVSRIAEESRTAAVISSEQYARRRKQANPQCVLYEDTDMPENLLLPGGRERHEAKHRFGDDGIPVDFSTQVGLVLRRGEERQFLEEWLNDVFTFESLVSAPTVPGARDGLGSSEALQEWFMREIEKNGEEFKN